jgi:hypothetical protein
LLASPSNSCDSTIAPSDAAGRDLGSSEALGAHRRARVSAQHRDLADVRQRVRDRTLEDLFRRMTDGGPEARRVSSERAP